MIALILSSLISIAVLNHDTQTCLERVLGRLEASPSAACHASAHALQMSAASAATTIDRIVYPKLNSDGVAGAVFESPFRHFWKENCEKDLVLAFNFFVAGLLSFLISVIFTTIVQFRVAAGAWYIAIIVAATALIWVCVSLLPQWSGAAKSSDSEPLKLNAYPRRQPRPAL